MTAAEGAQPMHGLAARGFSRDAGAYDRGRPDYPAAAVDRLVDRFRLGPASRVIDLAAGTGKMTRLLTARGLRPVAIEPVEAMRGVLAGVPGVRVIAGIAEAIPVRDGSLDAVTCAQAFHWFDAPRAVAEIARALRPGGGVAVLWNVRDESVPWVADLGRILDRLAGKAPRHRSGVWRVPFDGSGAFTPLLRLDFPHAQELTMDGVVDRFASVSYIAAMPPAGRAAVIEEVLGLLRTHPDTRGREVVRFPYRTELFLAARLAGPLPTGS